MRVSTQSLIAPVNPVALSKYLAAFANLNRKVSKRHDLTPHKPVLLLAVLDEIQRDAYPDGLIVITPVRVDIPGPR